MPDMHMQATPWPFHLLHQQAGWVAAPALKKEATGVCARRVGGCGCGEHRVSWKQEMGRAAYAPTLVRAGRVNAGQQPLAQPANRGGCQTAKQRARNAAQDRAVWDAKLQPGPSHKAHRLCLGRPTQVSNGFHHKSNSIRHDSRHRLVNEHGAGPHTLLALCFCRALNNCAVSCLVGSSAMMR